ncbi:MAG TPA: lysylphosphatidylglycerol synthase transmembrane domain-containing protein [Verrucomicrobiota bacterium]|nr:lysylphosphatidylglycerol synthase transmembrane domain-containing protein [Verrucomicrobiota bacterium]
MRSPRFLSVVRAVVGLLLLAAIFHAIFCNEVQLQLAAGGGPDWNSLTRWEQRRLAWSRGPAELWHTIRKLDAASLAGAFLICGALVGLGAWRWRQVLAEQGLNLEWREVLRISLVAQFFNAFLLGTAGGDVIKAWYVAQAAPHQRGPAAMTVFVDRILGTLGLLFAAVILAIPNWDLVVGYRRYQAVLLTVGGMLVVAAAILIIGFYTHALSERSAIARLLHRIPRGESAVRALAACRRFGRDPVFLLQMAGVSLLIAVGVGLAYVVLARGLGIQLPVVTLTFVSLSVVCLAALPVTPSGLGVRENLFVWLLALPMFELKPGLALSLSLLGYTVSLAWSAIGGLVYLLLPQRAEIAAVAAQKPAL